MFSNWFLKLRKMTFGMNESKKTRLILLTFYVSLFLKRFFLKIKYFELESRKIEK